MNFEKHIDTINNIMQDTGNKLAGLDAAIQTKREEIQNARRAANVTPAKLAVLTEERDEAEQKYREDTAAVIAAAKKAAQEARSALEKEAEDFSAVHPEAVDSATVALLNAGIMTGKDLVRLANENGENATMLRLFAKEAEKLMQDSPAARGLVAQIRAFLDPAARLEVFDGALLNSHIGAGAALFNVAKGAWDEIAYPEFRREMQQLNRFAFSGE